MMSSREHFQQVSHSFFRSFERPGLLEKSEWIQHASYSLPGAWSQCSGFPVSTMNIMTMSFTISLLLVLLAILQLLVKTP